VSLQVTKATSSRSLVNGPGRHDPKATPGCSRQNSGRSRTEHRVPGERIDRRAPEEIAALDTPSPRRARLYPHLTGGEPQAGCVCKHGKGDSRHRMEEVQEYFRGSKSSKPRRALLSGGEQQMLVIGGASCPSQVLPSTAMLGLAAYRQGDLQHRRAHQPRREISILLVEQKRPDRLRSASTTYIMETTVVLDGPERQGPLTTRTSRSSTWAHRCTRERATAT